MKTTVLRITFIVYMVLCFEHFAQAQQAPAGGNSGGGGSEEAEMFTRVAREMAQILIADPVTKKYGDLLLNTLNRKLEVDIVDSLSGRCDGRGADTTDYAYSCTGHIYLLKNPWANQPPGKGWLASRGNVIRHITDVFHEVFRASTPVKGHFYTNDAGYSVTNGPDLRDKLAKMAARASLEDSYTGVGENETAKYLPIQSGIFMQTGFCTSKCSFVIVRGDHIVVHNPFSPDRFGSVDYEMNFSEESFLYAKNSGFYDDMGQKSPHYAVREWFPKDFSCGSEIINFLTFGISRLGCTAYYEAHTMGYSFIVYDNDSILLRYTFGSEYKNPPYLKPFSGSFERTPSVLGTAEIAATPEMVNLSPGDIYDHYLEPKIAEDAAQKCRALGRRLRPIPLYSDEAIPQSVDDLNSRPLRTLRWTASEIFRCVDDRLDPRPIDR